MRRSAHSARGSAVLCGLAAMTLLLGACGLRGANPSGSGGSIIHPTGAQPVFSITYAGGMLANAHLTNVPGFWLSGDGQVVLPGAVPAIFPGPLMQPLNARRLTEEGVQKLLQAILDTGQFATSAEWRGAGSFVADANDTILTMHADGRAVTVTVYALGLLTPDQLAPGVDAAEVAAHAALNTLVDRLTTVDQWLPASAWADDDWHPYRPEALRLLVRNADEDPPDPSGIETTLIDWPVAGNPAAFGEPTVLNQRCGVVIGEDAAAWLRSFEPSNQLSRWVGHGHRYQVTPRPLLPGEPEDCPTG